jgi:hypothetical protein
VTGQEELKVNLPEGASDLQLFLEFYRLLSEKIRLIRLRISNPFCEPLGIQPADSGNGSVGPEPEIAMPDPVPTDTGQPVSEPRNSQSESGDLH